VSVGSLYQYYPTKEALVAAVIKRHAAEMIAVFESGLADLAHLPLPDSVRGVIVQTFRAYSVNPALHKVLLEEVPHVGVLVRERDFEERLERVTRGYLEFQRARIRPKNLELATRILLRAVEGVAAAIVVEDPTLLASPELFDEVTALVLRYVSAPSQAG
jgi:AcrR family transcriptional regulator